MEKIRYYLITFLVLVFSLSFVSSNFVCGLVNNSQDFSSSWAKVIIYPDDNTSKIVHCSVSPENKFCCDLDEIPSFNYSVGKKVFAEIFDEETGFVAGPVSLYLTGEGYDLFPQMNLEKAIRLNSPEDRVFINESSIILNVSLAEHYNNLNYTLNNSNGFLEENVCKDCIEVEFPVNLFKGRNEIILNSYGIRNISEKIIVYNLDYLNFSLNLSCDKCKVKTNYFYVPSQENITFSSHFESSHNISGEFLFYFPSEWILFNSSGMEDFSSTHNVVSENVESKKEFTINYTLESPKTFIKKEYIFTQKLENFESISKVRVFKFRFIPFNNKRPFVNFHFISPFIQKSSPEHPVLLESAERYLKTAAIFPNKQILSSYSALEFEKIKSGKNKGDYFTILTTIPERDIDKIFLVFKVEKGKSIEVWDNQDRVDLERYNEDKNYIYYSAYVYEKGPFEVRIS